MFMKRKMEDTINSSDKRNQFIREQVRPQRKKQVFLWIRRFGILVIAACVFGAISGGLIVYIQNHFLKAKEDRIISTYSSALPEESALSEETENSTGSSDISLNKVNRITRRLAAVGNTLDASLVGVRPKSSARDWYVEEDSGSKTEYGILVQESEAYFYILTTRSIIQEQSSVLVKLMDDTTVEGSILGSDMQLNIAMLRVKKSDIPDKLLEKMKVAKLANGVGMTNGTNVIAAGCPNGVLKSVVTGKITNNSIRASITDGEVRLYCTDMPFAEDGSGVMLNTDGRVIGILTADFTEKTGKTGMAFMRISDVMPVIELLREKKSAPYLGVEGTSLSTTVAKVHRLEAGAYVTEVYSGSPAYEGGMRVADVITKMGDKAISGMTEIYQELLKKKTGDTVVCTVIRTSGKGQITKELKIKLG